jgi:hypothetical protein
MLQQLLLLCMCSRQQEPHVCYGDPLCFCHDAACHTAPYSTLLQIEARVKSSKETTTESVATACHVHNTCVRHSGHLRAREQQHTNRQRQQSVPCS